MTQEEWRKLRAERLDRLQDWCGAIPQRGDLAVEEIWRREFWQHTEIKLTYEGEPGERIPAYLLIPRKGPGPPSPAIFAAHQCSCECDIGKEQVVGKCVDLPDQAYGLELVREGFVVLAPDANKVGERYDPALREPWQTAFEEIKDQSACCTAPGGSWGPIRWKRVFDVMRGLDFLCRHERVDADRIGMIGHSLGADTILWAMPLEPRIRAAAISGGGLVDHGSPYGLPYEEILSLLAPRPFLEVTGHRDFTNCRSDDPSLSTDERMKKKRDAHAQAAETYRLCEAQEALSRFEFDGDHCFPKEGRQAAYSWLKRWLMHS
jgi:dienelactone hydrolase